MKINKKDSIIKIDSGKKWPTLAVFAWVHGDEVCWVKAFQKMIPDLKITKWIVYFCYANLKAIEKNIRQTEVNLNRCFQKNEKFQWTYEKERAFELMEILDKCDALLDIHASFTEDSIPFVISEWEGLEIAKFLSWFEIRSNWWDNLEPWATDWYMFNNWKTWICIECWYLWDEKWQKRAEDWLESFLKYFDVIDWKNTLIKEKNQKEIFVDEIYITKNNFKLAKNFDDFQEIKKWELIWIDWKENIISERNWIIIFARNLKWKWEEAFILGKKK